MQAHLEAIERVESTEFWQEAGFAELEWARVELRDIMKHVLHPAGGADAALVVDVAEDRGAVETATKTLPLEGLEFAAYRQRVGAVFQGLLETNPVLQRIQQRQPVTEANLAELRSLVTAQAPDLDLAQLERAYPKTAGHLELAIRRIIGLAPEAVKAYFAAFHTTHPELNAKQIRFLDLLAGLIAQSGALEVERLYESPFTNLHEDGIDGLFDETESDDLVALIEQFDSPVQ